MDTSIFIAKILGLSYIVVGLGLLFSSGYYKKLYEDMMKNTGIMYLGGIMALIVGYLMVTYHNFWVKDWTVIITVLGWLALLKGFFLLVLPEQMVKLTLSLFPKKNMNVWGGVVLVLGLVLGYFGFFM
ncbi:hypothetical protein KJ742_04570 [Patescibacteria group bacterium]|nr:hypothetical protein [Patescibacteria group bacterium]MBU1683193.1 hypothetical protein [Patescibacteria group bacterium]MBU1935559.1 hypothetical protein [Patescibacteria group bacterium]